MKVLSAEVIDPSYESGNEEDIPVLKLEVSGVDPYTPSFTNRNIENTGYSTVHNSRLIRVTDANTRESADLLTEEVNSMPLLEEAAIECSVSFADYPEVYEWCDCWIKYSDALKIQNQNLNKNINEVFGPWKLVPEPISSGLKITLHTWVPTAKPCCRCYRSGVVHPDRGAAVNHKNLRLIYLCKGHLEQYNSRQAAHRIKKAGRYRLHVL